MDKVGRSLRSDVKMIMTRSLKPCRLTAGGFFPISLETFTSVCKIFYFYLTFVSIMYAARLIFTFAACKFHVFLFYSDEGIVLEKRGLIMYKMDLLCI